MNLKEIYELGIKELSKEPSNSYKLLDDLLENYHDYTCLEILQKIDAFDIYVYEFLNKEEYYSEISNFPKKELLKKDIDYYRATYYRIRYHFTYFNDRSKNFINILTYGIHLASNLREWLDFHFKTLDEELITHIKAELKKLNAEGS